MSSPMRWQLVEALVHQMLMQMAHATQRRCLMLEHSRHLPRHPPHLHQRTLMTTVGTRDIICTAGLNTRVKPKPIPPRWQGDNSNTDSLRLC